MPSPHIEADLDWLDKYAEAVRLYQKRDALMTADIFRATLKSLGFRGQEIEAEVNLWMPM